MCILCGGCGLCTMCCSACSSVGIHQKNWPKVSYVIMDIIMMIIAFILMFTLRPLADAYPDHFSCNETAGGGANCCGGPIASSGLSCDDTGAPCNITPPMPDPTCALGLISGDTCCSTSCGVCGGSGCGANPGGGANCCGGPIASSGVSCDTNSAPCVIGL